MYQAYPSYARNARTFAELFRDYSMDWPLPSFVDASLPPWGGDKEYAEHLLGRAKHVASQFPEADLWDEHLEETLRQSMQAYDPQKGKFDRLFERNLLRRLRRERARNSERAARERAQAKEAAQVRRPAPVNDAAASYGRWSVYLLDRAYPHLDHATRTYLDLRRTGASVSVIADTLQVPEQSLHNRHGGAKLGRQVRRAVQQVVTALPPDHQALLVRHLLDEAGLSPDQVRELVGPVSVPLTGVPVLEEDDVLAVLGW
jgi:hypothetical protein